jgi:hypothetical protein
MNDQASDLLGIIREEICLCRDLVEHSQHKATLIALGSVEDILESNRIEESHSSRLLALEEDMKRLCCDLGRTCRIPSEEVTIMKLADYFERSLALEIKGQSDICRNLMQQLSSVSRRNKRLIEKSMRLSNGLLAIISNATGAYHQSGSFEQIPSLAPTFSRQA